jgi:phospholipase C
MAKIDHVFVLMLENRSFDHFFAFSDLPGVPQAPGSFNFKPDAPNRLTTDPPHEFENVRGQMTGFAGVGLQGFVPTAIPTLIKLAQNSLFFVCCSMPRPRSMNFIHSRWRA